MGKGKDGRSANKRKGYSPRRFADRLVLHVLVAKIILLLALLVICVTGGDCHVGI